jgi:hypothetical protein
MPVAVIPANRPSADAPTQIAPGLSTANGTIARAACGLPSSATVDGTATAARPPTTTHAVAAKAPPPSPMRSSQTNTSVAPGGWPDTCVVHERGPPSRIRELNSRSMAGMSVMPGTSCRYSVGVVSRSAKPRDQPSTIASEKVQASVAK